MSRLNILVLATILAGAPTARADDARAAVDRVITNYIALDR